MLKKALHLEAGLALAKPAAFVEAFKMRRRSGLHRLSPGGDLSEVMPAPVT
jgi:hypothetical protein